MSKDFAELSIQGDRALSLYLKRAERITEDESLREPLFEAAAVYQHRVSSLLQARYKRRWVSRDGKRSRVYPDPRGRLERGVRRRMPRSQAQGALRVHVGWYYNWQDKDAASHVHLLERGTANRWTKRGQFRGKVEPMRFWRDAVASSEAEAQEIIRSGVKGALNI